MASTAAVARADQRQLAGEGHELLVDERLARERLPGAIEIGRPAEHRLSLAVVAEAARLQDAGQAERRDRML